MAVQETGNYVSFTAYQKDLTSLYVIGRSVNASSRKTTMVGGFDDTCTCYHFVLLVAMSLLYAQVWCRRSRAQFPIGPTETD